MKNIEDIIVAHLNDEASAEQVKRLFEWVREEPENAKEFARCALLHAQLRGQFAGEKRVHASGETLVGRPSTSSQTRKSRRNWKFIAPALAVCLLIAVGATLASLGPALSGLLYDQPDLAYLDPAQTSLYAEAVDGGGAEAMAWLGTAGLLVVIAGALLFMLNLVVSLVLRNGTKADSDPWDGAAPEWMLDSPPRPGILDALPDLDSGTPLLDMAEAGGDEQDAAEEVKV